MKKAKVPFKRTVFVCVHARPDGARASCGPRGGEALCAALKAAVKDAGLSAKVRVARSGCLDLCEKGPNAFLYPSGDWLAGLSPEDAPRLAQALAD